MTKGESAGIKRVCVGRISGGKKEIKNAPSWGGDYSRVWSGVGFATP